MLLTLLGRLFRRCIQVADDSDRRAEYASYDPDYMTDAEIDACLHGGGHTVNWSEVKRRRAAGELQAPWFPRDATGWGT
jgi:hypothetical protein